MPPSRARTSDRQNRELAPLPPYQPPQHPLNEKAQRALHNLLRDHKLDNLKDKLRAANNHLTQAAADVNDRLQERTVDFEKRKKRQDRESLEEIDNTIDEMRQKTDGMTDKLEEKVRSIIDASTAVEGMERALQELQENVSNNRGRVANTQSTVGVSQANQSRRGRIMVEEGDEEESDFEGNVATTQPTATQTAGESDALLSNLKRKIATQRATYQNMSMSQRYASHNDYVGFKKIVHDAHYPSEEAPPMPHSSTWFESKSPASSHPATRKATAAGHTPIDDEDDLAVASERISIKCPITLLPMKEPVTSLKCPHSFEKAAILDMINNSDIIIDGTGRRGQSAMKCPVCEVLLTANDLKEDPVLIRKIKRIQVAMNAQNEESSDEEEDARHRKSAGPHSEQVDSSPAIARTSRLKSERQRQAPGIPSRQVSIVPNTQIRGLTDKLSGQLSSSTVIDLEDEDEDEDMGD